MSIVPGSKKVPAGIIAIVLGSLGIHKFFLGLNRAGAVMLILWFLGFLTAGIGIGHLIWLGLGIVSFVEGIIYLTKSDEQFYREYVVNKKDWF